MFILGFSMWCSGKESTCQCRRCKRCGFDPWVGKSPWSRKWKPTPVFLSGKFHGQQSLVGYSPWGRKELDMTKHTNTRHARFDENLNKINLTYSRPPRWLITKPYHVIFVPDLMFTSTKVPVTLPELLWANEKRIKWIWRVNNTSLMSKAKITSCSIVPKEFSQQVK